MAITISKQPSGIYPAYNDAYLVFSSNLSGDYKAEVQITQLSNQVFTIYPDLSGNYTFNLKEVVRILLNSNGFKDQDDSYPAGWTKEYPYGYQTVNVTLRCYNTTTNDSTSTSYNFIRGVKQIGEVVHANTAQLMHPSTNGVDYSLTYFEGYPFSFEIQRLTSADSLVFKNLNTGDLTSAVIIGGTNTHRVFVDKVSANWTSSNYLPLPDVLNRLEISVNASPVTNLNLKKIMNPCGVYLKWINQDGGYSYWLFDEYFKTTYKGREYGEVATNTFLNLADGIVAPTQSLGYQASESYKLKTSLDALEAKHLKSLFTSPSVQLWSQQEPYIAGEWIDVRVASNYEYSNKKNTNELRVEIDLPRPITPML